MEHFSLRFLGGLRDCPIQIYAASMVPTMGPQWYQVLVRPLIPFNKSTSNTKMKAEVWVVWVDKFVMVVSILLS